MARVVCFMRTEIVNKPESNFTVNSKIEINSGCILCVSLAPLLCNWIARSSHSSPYTPLLSCELYLKQDCVSKEMLF
jgi:hypothetical protein